MIGAPDHLPGVTMVVDETAPCQSLVTDADFALCSAFAERGEILGRPIDTAECRRGTIRADEDEVDAHLMHNVEFALGAIEGALALGAGQAFEVAERLIERNIQPEIAGDAADIGRRAVVGQKIVLKDFHAVEAGRCDGLEFFLQIAAERNRGDGCFHAILCGWCRRWRAWRNAIGSTLQPVKIRNASTPW